MGSQNLKEFVISRAFDAPRELIWKAFTDPERMKQWWGPKGCEILSCTVDLRPGGLCHYGMRFVNQDMWGRMVYREIHPPGRIIFVNSFSDEQGGLARHPLAPTWPKEMLSTITFEEQGDQTSFTVRWAPLAPTPEEQQTFEKGHASMRQGWTGTFERLEAYLAKRPGSGRLN